MNSMDADVDMIDAPCGTSSNNNDTVCPKDRAREDEDGFISDESSFYGTTPLCSLFPFSKGSPRWLTFLSSCCRERGLIGLIYNISPSRPLHLPFDNAHNGKFQGTTISALNSNAVLPNMTLPPTGVRPTSPCPPLPPPTAGAKRGPLHLPNHCTTGMKVIPAAGSSRNRSRNSWRGGRPRRP